MNRKTLQKIIDELSKDNFRKDYILGILEMALESLPEDRADLLTPKSLHNDAISVMRNASIPGTVNGQNVDEGSALDMAAMARIKGVATNAIQTEN